MSKGETGAPISERALGLLKLLVQEHVRTGRPVGSRKLSKLHPDGLSSATIRNEVADLEDLGYVTQPHASAGRQPTILGYRFYVDSMSETPGLSDQHIEKIRRSLEQETDLDALMDKTSKLLSSLSNNVGFVLVPPLSMTALKHIEFIKISRQRILVILVAPTGFVQHRLIELEGRLEQVDLDQAGRYLVHNFEGRTLMEIRAELIRLMSQDKALYDRLLRKVIVLCAAGLIEDPPNGDEEGAVYLGGTARLIEMPEIKDVQRMIKLFQTFEEKSRMVKLVSRCVHLDQPGPTVTIGLEDHLPDMHDFTLVSSPYVYHEGATGSLGIIGPNRMEYDRVIGLVDYVANLFTRLLNENEQTK